jgi:signal transduction histidine kinase
MGRGMQLSARLSDGEELPVEISLGHYSIEEEPYVIAFIIDISKRIEIENNLRRQKEEVEKAKQEIEKLNEELEHKVVMRTQELSDALSKERELSDLKSRFVSMASHEFRTPLSTILSSISLIAKYTGSDEQDKRDKHIHRIKSAVSNLTDILNEFLSLGKIEEGKIQLHFSECNLKEQLQLIKHTYLCLLIIDYLQQHYILMVRHRLEHSQKFLREIILLHLQDLLRV